MNGALSSGGASSHPGAKSKPGGAKPESAPGAGLAGAGFISAGGSASGKPPTGWGRVARFIALAANGLVGLSRLGFSRAKQQSGKALTRFSQRPEHTRQRVYAFAGYGAVIALTFAAQLWDPNSLSAYVKVEPVALPEATVIFVRNDSSRLWKDVKVTLNGRYSYQRLELPPTRYISLPVDRFAFYDRNGKATYAAKEIVPRAIAVDCDRGHFELDLEQR